MTSPTPTTQIEQPTQTPNFSELDKAFAQVAFQWAMTLNHATNNKDTENSRFKWLSEEATNLAAVAMQFYSEAGVK